MIITITYGDQIYFRSSKYNKIVERGAALKCAPNFEVCVQRWMRLSGFRILRPLLDASSNGFLSMTSMLASDIGAAIVNGAGAALPNLKSGADGATAGGAALVAVGVAPNLNGVGGAADSCAFACAAG